MTAVKFQTFYVTVLRLKYVKNFTKISLKFFHKYKAFPLYKFAVLWYYYM